MATFYQIAAFYLFLGLVTNGLLGYYPHLDPTHPSLLGLHLKIGKICTHSLMTLNLVALIYLIVQRFRVASLARKHQLELPSRLKTKMLMAALGVPLCIFGALKIYLSGKAMETGEVAINAASKTAHFHSNTGYVLIIVLGSFLVAAALLQMRSTFRDLSLKAGFAVPAEPFLRDHHYYRMVWAKRFLFLGINVWWPYLLLKFGLGLSALQGLWFLPIHLAGVIPFSILKRKHKFQRTLNPEFQGRVRSSERYVQAESSA